MALVCSRRTIPPIISFFIALEVSGDKAGLIAVLSTRLESGALEGEAIRPLVTLLARKVINTVVTHYIPGEPIPSQYSIPSMLDRVMKNVTNRNQKPQQDEALGLDMDSQGILERFAFSQDSSMPSALFSAGNDQVFARALTASVHCDQTQRPFLYRSKANLMVPWDGHSVWLGLSPDPFRTRGTEIARGSWAISFL
ncbi:hypothetical protein RRG08_009074 [Elysia crispata]|uniref:Uncharacterized protein n=1 Tax=Elysia crispata TaxID=231223 RepID=A0AAE0Y7R8_9GAST|nr:hypothetical protein RRG08_009074 [Elysia crispata]